MVALFRVRESTLRHRSSVGLGAISSARLLGTRRPQDSLETHRGHEFRHECSRVLRQNSVSVQAMDEQEQKKRIIESLRLQIRCCQDQRIYFGARSGSHCVLFVHIVA